MRRRHATSDTIAVATREELMSEPAYPARFSIDYPDRQLDRVSTAFRVITIIPIAIVAASLSGAPSSAIPAGQAHANHLVGGAALVTFPALLMILFRQKYPRWWFDWNVEAQRFGSRIIAYLALMDDRYPSTDEEQSVHLENDYPDAKQDLNRWLPLVKWLFAFPHYILLAILYIGVFFAVIGAWFAILFTGHYPRGLFDYVEGVFRWQTRVWAYAIILITDRYPPFSLKA
jgi:hypothetical protein